MRRRSADSAEALAPVVVFSANSLFNIMNFRTGLIKAVAAAGFKPIVAAPSDRSQGQLPQLPAELVPVRIDRSGLNPLTDVRLLVAYLRLCRRLRPAAYVSFTIKPNIYGSLAARIAGVPSIVNVSGLGTSFLRSGVFAAFVSMLYRIAFKRSSVVFFQNPDDHDLFLSRKIVRADQARLLPGSGIDLEHFQPILSAAASGQTFLFIGRLIADKGVREFAAAAQMVRQTHPGARFILLGALDPGNRSSITAEELQSWLDANLVEHLGQTDDVRPTIAAADAVVLPSYREGLPRSLLEGGAMGKPLIATDVPGNRELVKDGVTGLICRVHDAMSLADTMRRFLEMDSAGQQALGEAALDLVRTSFGERRVIEAYLDVLKPLRLVRG